MSDDNELRFLLFDEFGHSVGSGTDLVGAFGWGVLLLGDLCFCSSLQAVLLLDFRFGPVFFKQFEELSRYKSKSAVLDNVSEIISATVYRFVCPMFG